MTWAERQKGRVWFTEVLTFRLEELDTDGLIVRAVLLEDVDNVLLLNAVGGVEEVQHIRRVGDAILQSRLGIREAIVSIAHVVLEGARAIWKVKGLLDIIEECLLGEAQLHLMPKEGDLVEGGNGPLDRHRVAHLHHRTAFLALQKFDLKEKRD